MFFRRCNDMRVTSFLILLHSFQMRQQQPLRVWKLLPVGLALQDEPVHQELHRGQKVQDLGLQQGRQQVLHVQRRRPGVHREDSLRQLCVWAKDLHKLILLYLHTN